MNPAAFAAALVLAAPRPLAAADLVLERGGLRVVVAHPGAPAGPFRGPRFDWGSHLPEVTWRGHAVCRPWRPELPPEHPEAASGPAEEFAMQAPPGYEAAAPGELFLKPGVGLLRRLDAKPYFFNAPYPIAEPARWTAAREGEGAVVLRAEQAHGPFGYALERRFAVSPEGVLTISRTLRNTGTDRLRLNHYAHNFLAPGGAGLRPGVTLTLASPAALARAAGPAPGWALADGLTLRWAGPELTPGKTGFARLAAPPEGALPTALTLAAPGAPYTLRLEVSQPPAALNVYGAAAVVCPEFFVELDLAPGESAAWADSWKLAEP